MENRSEFEINKRLFIVMSGGLLTVGIIILQAFLSMGKLDIAATISLSAFVIAIPLLAASVLNFSFIVEKNSDIYHGKVSFLFWTGAIIALIGMAAAIYHASLIAGSIFPLSAFATIQIMLSKDRKA